MSTRRLFSRLAALALGLIAAATAASADAQLSNVATLSFATDSGRQTVDSNKVTLDVDFKKRPTRILFYLPPVGYEFSGMKCTTTPTLSFTPAPVSASDLARAPVAQGNDVDGPMIIVLENPGGNHDPAVREQAWVNVENRQTTVKVPLMETDVNSGVFAGGIPRHGYDPAFDPCDPTLVRGEQLKVSFDEDAYSTASTASMLLDPAGFAYDSMTGTLIDDAVVSLVDENGDPATVYGDDGISTYPSTVTSGHEAMDSSGRVYRFPTGYFRFPLAAPGRYHLVVQPPDNYRAPSTRSVSELEKLRDPQGRRFIINEASFGRSFLLDSPKPFYSDIPLDRAGETVLLATKTASVRSAELGDFVQYQITIQNRGKSPTTGVTITDTLPEGIRYRFGSTRGAEEPTISKDGKALVFTVPVISPGRTAELTYVVSVAPNAPVGEAVNRVFASGSDGTTSNEATAGVRIRAPLMTSGFTLIGRVTEGSCETPEKRRKGVPNIRLVLEDGTFVMTDKDGLYHIEGIRPGRHVVQMDDLSVPASLEAQRCGRDTRSGGNALSRFVESDGGLLKRADFILRPTGKIVEASAALPLTVVSAAEAAGAGRDWGAGQAPGIAMLFPTEDYNPRAPVTRVVVKHMPGQKVALRVNGKLTDPLSFDATDNRGGLAISRWSGISLETGDNRLEATVMDANGAVVETLARIVHSSGNPVRAHYVPEKSRLAADGLNRPLIAVRLTDAAGRPVRDGTTIPFEIDAPYIAAVDAELMQARPLAGKGPTPSTGMVVGDDGIAFLALEPTTEAGAVHIRVLLRQGDGQNSNDHVEKIESWLAAPARDWMVVGFGSGTLGYQTLKKRSTALPHSEHGIVTDGQLALYAKGRIKGSWLLTLAYDSDRRFDPDRGLLGVIDPDRYYTVYGGGSRQGYDAATAGKLYLRLERREFYALFGDFETGMTETVLGRYSRTLNGAKAGFRGRGLRASAFAAHGSETFARDEIAGNGLSGPYRLSQSGIVPNSDKLRIETRDRLRPQIVIKSAAMTRHIDYDIDPDAGTLRFKAPVMGRDTDRNPVVIVVEYETYGRNKQWVTGGRIAAESKDGDIQAGVSAIHDQTAADATLVAVDLKLKPIADTEVRAEIAAGGRGGLNAGKAWLVEAEHHGKTLDFLAYARQQGTTFGLGQQNVVDAGARRIGADARYQITDRLGITATGWHQDQLGGKARRTAGEARVEWRRNHGSVFAGMQFADDRGTDGSARRSLLMTLGGSQALLDGKLVLSGQTQIAPGGARDSVDFPVRHQINAAYSVAKGIRLLAGYEIAKGKDFTAHAAQVGFDVAPWTGAKLMSTLNQASAGEDGQRTYAQYGLSQALTFGRNWTLDATLDSSRTLHGTAEANPRYTAFQPISSGSSIGGQERSDGDYTAITLGAGYHAGRWSWNGRIEYRQSDANTRWGFTTNALRMLGDGRTVAASFNSFRLKDRAGAAALTREASIALALRPTGSRWAVLERLQFRDERADRGIDAGNGLGAPIGNGNGARTLRAVNNVAINYRSDPGDDGRGIEVTLYHGAKWVRGSYGADDYQGFIQILGFDLRKDLGKRFDIGLQGAVRHAATDHAFAFSGGPTIGVSPAGDMWLTLGYNVEGYRDRDFEQDRYTRKGPYVTLRLKFDQYSLRDSASRLGFGR